MYIKGRQILHRIVNHNKVSETVRRLLEFRDLMDLNMNGDDIRGLVDTWDATLLPMGKDQIPRVLGIMCLRHTQRHQIQHKVAYYEILPTGDDEIKYDFLYRVVIRHLESRRTIQARSDMIRGNTRPALPATDKYKVCVSWRT